MSSISKMLAILDLFSDEKAVWTPEEIMRELDFSAPTAYRYLRELAKSGLIASDNGHYKIGPKIIKLDFLIRKTDPIVSAGMPIMKQLCELTGCEVLLSNIFNDEILIAHIESPNRIESKVTYNRGQPHPLFYGSTSKAIIANLPRAQITKLYEKYPELINEAGMGKTFEEFKSKLSVIKRQGYYISHGELDKGVSGIAVPVFKNNVLKGSLSLVFATELYEIYNVEKLTELAIRASKDIGDSTAVTIIEELNN